MRVLFSEQYFTLLSAGACKEKVKALSFHWLALQDAQLLVACLSGGHWGSRHSPAAQEGPWWWLGQDLAAPHRCKQVGQECSLPPWGGGRVSERALIPFMFYSIPAGGCRHSCSTAGFLGCRWLLVEELCLLPVPGQQTRSVSCGLSLPLVGCVQLSVYSQT